MPFQIIRNDITKVRADAVVNTANPEPVYADGTDRAIYMAAGAEQLLAERRKIGRIRRGEAAATRAFALPARYIIHTVGPVWQGGGSHEFEILASCYRSSLMLAERLGCESIAFPLISTGVYGFPKEKALEIALSAISDFLKEHEMNVTLVVFQRDAFRLSARLTDHVRQYIDDRYVEQKTREFYRKGRRAESSNQMSEMSESFMAPDIDLSEEMPVSSSRPPEDFPTISSSRPPEDFPTISASRPPEDFPTISASRPSEDYAPKPAARPKRRLSDLLRHVGESFQECLLRLIDERGLTDTEVYKRANLDRKLFSKIRCNPHYNPKKRTAVALAIALRLNLDETVDLLKRAGIALSPSDKFDLIVEYCIENKIYDIFEVNAILFEYDQQLLG